ncbi:MAG: hypothetical protein U1F68_14920 [Gammaproteobacteria bacterium]
MSALPMLTTLPDIDTAKLPAVYERATQALAECNRIDECQDWADKAQALASYARQSKDDSLRKMADRIQARAIRRCGELLRQVEPNKGGDPSLFVAQDGTVPRVTRTNAATKAGLSERQRKTALRVANIAPLEFEAAVESDAPPTVTQLAERGKQARPAPLHSLDGIDPFLYARATELQGTIKLLAEFCGKYDPHALAKAFKPHEIPRLRQAIADIEAWIDRFIVSL